MSIDPDHRKRHHSESDDEDNFSTQVEDEEVLRLDINWQDIDENFGENSRSGILRPDIVYPPSVEHFWNVWQRKNIKACVKLLDYLSADQRSWMRGKFSVHLTRPRLNVYIDYELVFGGMNLSRRTKELAKLRLEAMQIALLADRLWKHVCHKSLSPEEMKDITKVFVMCFTSSRTVLRLSDANAPEIEYEEGSRLFFQS